MIRRVAFGKAVAAGSAGALAWELLARLGLAAGLPIPDIVFLLGTLLAGPGDPWRWWFAGAAVHVLVGAMWAVFYAYFFWSTLAWPPALQGAAFSLLPASLAGLVMLPQVGLMHPLVLDGAIPAPGVFAAGVGWAGPPAVVGGHLLYGAVTGALYRRPTGRPAGRRKARAAAPHA